MGGYARGVMTSKLTGDALTCLHQSNGFQHTPPTRLILRSGTLFLSFSSTLREATQVICRQWAVFLRPPKPLAPGQPFRTWARASSLWATVLGWGSCRSGSVSKGLQPQGNLNTQRMLQAQSLMLPGSLPLMYKIWSHDTHLSHISKLAMP